jgi:hypothetical protein
LATRRWLSAPGAAAPLHPKGLELQKKEKVLKDRLAVPEAEAKRLQKKELAHL